MSVRTSEPDSQNRGSARSPLAKAGWQYVERPDLDAFIAADWAVLDAQRRVYDGEERARQALRMLEMQAGDTTFGYAINNYRHCLQSATMVMQDGHDDETIVVALLHDVGFIVCPGDPRRLRRQPCWVR